MKKVLFIATVYRFLNFEKSDMEILKQMGFEIHLATNMNGEKWLKDDGCLDYLDVKKHHIDFNRLPFSFDNLKAYKQLRQLINNNNFSLIHCHTPIAGAIARLAAITARAKGTKVVYTSHGFHFHKYSTLKDWLFYYPIEFLLAPLSDMIITINKEDYKIIQNFFVKNKMYIPGVGVDVNKIQNIKVNKNDIRKKIGLPLDSFVVLSVGELSNRKNHQVIINAIASSNIKNIYYLICGTGDKLDFLRVLAKKLGIENKVMFLGQQSHDYVLELLYASDIGALPSLIEGLGLAGIECIAAGKPIVASSVHGINDYAINELTGLTCLPNDVQGFKNAIERYIEDKIFYEKCSENAKIKALEFEIPKVRCIMQKIYLNLLE